MRVIWHDGRVYGGADALRFLAWQFWYTIPLAIVFGLPGVKGLTNAVYRRLAERRHCIVGGCSELKERPGRKWVGWAILTVFVGVAAIVGWAFSVTPWVWMWVLAGALWLGFKCMNFSLEGGFRMVHSLYFVWVGTETNAFRKEGKAAAGGLRLGSSPVFVGLGLGALIGVVPQFNHPIAVGWLGIFSMLLLVHFGIFGLLGGILNGLGIGVKPIMEAPWKAKTLSEFWGRRWNRAFSDWARVWIFRPMVRKLGGGWGTLAGFLASGVAHELVVSLPARGGLGLPTVYFVLQAGGVLAQRRIPAIRGRWCTLGFVLIPAPILFHSRFVDGVFAPMVRECLTLTNF